MSSIPELIVQWRQKQMSGSALMRALVSFDKWVLPISEAAVAEALATNSLPSLLVTTSPDGAKCLAVYSSSDALFAYRKAANAKGSQHYVTVHGTWLFKLPLEGFDHIWIDPATADDIYYAKEQFNSLRDMAHAIEVEEALSGLRKGTSSGSALQTAREYKNYYLPVTTRNDQPAFVLAPDTKGRSLAAAFTSDDTFDAFLPEAIEMSGGGEVKQMQIDGEALFDTFQRMRIDGFVFNCCGPVPAVAFQQAVAEIILQA